MVVYVCVHVTCGFPSAGLFKKICYEKLQQYLFVLLTLMNIDVSVQILHPLPIIYEFLLSTVFFLHSWQAKTTIERIPFNVSKVDDYLMS